MNKFILSFIFWLIVTPAEGFRLSPMVAEISPRSQKQRTQSFFIENTSDKRVAVQVSVFERFMDVAGAETRKETELFSFYPPQMILEPKQRRTVRVTWKGESEVSTEKAYRLVAEQLPIDLKEKEASQQVNIQFLLKYVASIYVVPRKSKVDIIAESAVVKMVKEKKIIDFLLKNQGNVHKVLVGMEMTLENKPAKFKARLTAEGLKSLAAENILAGQSRRVLYEVPESLKTMPLGALKVYIKFDE